MMFVTEAIIGEITRGAFDSGSDQTKSEIIKIIEHCKTNNYTDEQTLNAVIDYAKEAE